MTHKSIQPSGECTYIERITEKHNTFLTYFGWSNWILVSEYISSLIIISCLNKQCNYNVVLNCIVQPSGEN